MARKPSYEELERRLKDLDKRIPLPKLTTADDPIQQLEFLSESATGFLDLPPSEDVYLFTAKRLKELGGDCIVVVNSFDEERCSLRVHALVGLGERTEAVVRIMGQDPVGQTFLIDDEAKSALINAKLVQVPEGVYGLSPEIPRVIWRTLENLLGLRDAYSMGFSWKGQLFGNVAILTRKGSELKNQRLIETFVRMAAVALQHRRAEEALRESEEKYRTLTEFANDFILVVQEGETVYRNSAYERLVGYSVAETKGRSFLDVVAPEDRDRVREYYVKRLKGEKVPDQYEARIQTRGGQRLTMEVKPRIIQYKGRRASMAVMHDITRRKRAEEALADEKERLAVTLRSIGDGVITTDLEGRVTLINRVGEALTGWSLEEALGRPLTDVFCIIDRVTRKRRENPLKKAMEAGDVVRLADDTVLVSREGTEYIIADSGAPIFDREGKTIGLVLVFGDITEKWKMERELLKVQKLESLGVLAGGIAHDFNNILTALVGNISLAKMDLDQKDRIYRLLEGAERASWRAQTLTQQLLTFSKGGAPVKKSTCIPKLLHEWASFALRGSKARCDFAIPDVLWSAQLDEGQIGQVIQNLIINADQAMPEGGIITLRAENRELKGIHGLPLRPGRYVRVSVQDKGIGISDEHLPKIFDPYFTTKQRGIGLGLATAYSIIKGHNGHITVESQLGVGTTVHVYLPASKEEFLRNGEKQRRPTVGTGKILLMDDEEMIRSTAKDILRHIGYTAEVACDGAEAIELYARAKEAGESFDAVILDLTVPGGLGGKETIRRLREVDPEVVAIVSSGYSTDPILSNFTTYGFCGVIAKPYRIEELNQVLIQAIRDNN
jgi:PAS domain S-box-containing protein